MCDYGSVVIKAFGLEKRPNLHPGMEKMSRGTEITEHNVGQEAKPAQHPLHISWASPCRAEEALLAVQCLQLSEKQAVLVCAQARCSLQWDRS